MNSTAAKSKSAKDRQAKVDLSTGVDAWSITFLRRKPGVPGSVDTYSLLHNGSVVLRSERVEGSKHSTALFTLIQGTGPEFPFRDEYSLVHCAFIAGMLVERASPGG
jgi:hypothetical protein